MAAANLLSGQYVLTLRCSGMTTYIGSPFHIRVIETATGDEVGRKTIASIMDDTLNIQLFVLLGGKDYQVDFYVDRNSNDTYEPPPTDHAWRRMVTNVSGPATIDFVPFVDYTDIAFPDIVYGYYDAAWGGLWKNLTFGSTDSIEAAFQVACDSIVFSFTTAGVFGNPDTVSFDFVVARPAEYNPVTDTLRFPVNPPWTGDAYVTNGEFHGNISLLNFSLLMTGTIGQKQLLSQYTVTDGGSPIANGYFYVKELEIINEFLPLGLELTGTPISCHGGSNGSISAFVTGGTGNYEYSWLETGSTTPYIEGLWADTFNVVVMDDLGCHVEGSYIIYETGSVNIDAVDIIEASCPGVCDAVIAIIATGGTLPYTYYIQSDACTGPATIFVTDALGCEDSTTVIIGTMSDLEVLDLFITDASDGLSNGSVEIEAEGGIPPYQYSLDGIQFQFSPVFMNLPPGSYCITIMDENGCTIKTDTFLIENITGIREITTNLKIYPNPVSANLHVESDSPVSVDLLDLDGHVQRHSTSSRVFDIGVAAFPRGMYFLRVSDGAGYLFQKIILN